MAKKTKSENLKTAGGAGMDKKKSEGLIENDNMLNHELFDDKESKKKFFLDLIECVKKWKSSREEKSKLLVLYRKHIDWTAVGKMMMVDNDYSEKMVDSELIKNCWKSILKHIKIEKTLNQILDECDKAVTKAFKIPTQSGFTMFLKHMRPKVKSKKPKMSCIELHQKVVSKWKTLSEEKKQVYVQEAIEENKKNGVGVSSRKRAKLESDNKDPLHRLNIEYPNCTLKEFYVSYTAKQLKFLDPELPLPERKKKAYSSFGKCSFQELTEIKVKYSEQLETFVQSINSHPDDINEIGNFIMNSKRLRPLLEQPIISKFLSQIKPHNSDKKKSAEQHEDASSDAESNDEESNSNDSSDREDHVSSQDSASE